MHASALYGIFKENLEREAMDSTHFIQKLKPYFAKIKSAHDYALASLQQQPELHRFLEDLPIINILYRLDKFDLNFTDIRIAMRQGNQNLWDESILVDHPSKQLELAAVPLPMEEGRDNRKPSVVKIKKPFKNIPAKKLINDENV